MLSLAELEQIWDTDLIPQLCEYIKIPNQSPAFDADWQSHGYMDQAMNLLENWVARQKIQGLLYEVVRLPNRTPLLFIEIPGQSEDTVLLYGHMDKQPEMFGWEPDLGPWQPVIRDNKLYGRGGADDGYAVFAALTAIRLLQEKNVALPRCVVIIEGCEESGSYDLPFYLDALKDRIQSPKLVITLDSDCGNYEQLWLTTSLRGLMGGQLRVETQTEGVHSGLGSGVMPSCFSVLRELLDRIENSHTHDIPIEALHADIPELRATQNKKAAQAVGGCFFDAHPLTPGTEALSKDIGELKLNQTWRPTLTVTGLDGLPATARAGNVRLPYVVANLSFRLPPTVDPKIAAAAIKEVLETNPPHGAKVSFTVKERSRGWVAPTEENWLLEAGHLASQQYFNRPLMLSGGGGTIPFMGLLGKQYPEAQFFITGVLGPKSNAHGPNEFLHIPYVKRLTGCVGVVLAEAFKALQQS